MNQSNHNMHRQEPYPGPLEQKLEQVVSPFQHFIRDQTTGSLLLIFCTVVALAVANSMFANDYETFINGHAGIFIGPLSLDLSIRHWVNDGLMALFFFVLGLEIKREILVGELRDRRQSFPVIAAAIGGMVAPTAIYFVLNAGTDYTHGWGIPMATDTAFAVGILALLGRRIPLALTTFLTALAIIDDLGAIMVIAVFYTSHINTEALLLAAVALMLLVLCNLSGCRRAPVYLLGGALVWLAMLDSGLHPTIAGILVAATVPARPKRESHWFQKRARHLIDKFEAIDRKRERPILAEEEQHAVVEQVQQAAEKATTPLRRWERSLERPIALFVMPVFALANAGIPISVSSIGQVGNNTLSLGIILGLVFGKSLGISLMVWLALKFNLGNLPAGVSMRHIIGLGLLGGMGFTMSIFIASLGFDHDSLVMAKTAILLASLLAGVMGYIWLRLAATADGSNDEA